MKILVTGGCGFIGSHVAEYHVKKGDEVVVFDNLSRENTSHYNRSYLKKNFEEIKFVRDDIRNIKKIKNVLTDVNAIYHTAAQTAVTTSIDDPKSDFEINASGTLNLLEAVRTSNTDPAVIYCSTNKVYGENVNRIPLREEKFRYLFNDEKFKKGIPESFQIDRCEHTPYGCSKLTGDLYVQDYGKLYGLKSAVFRMSCIYGPRQFGTEEQGWIAHFAISTLKGKPLFLYGDGKQVRDVLYVDDLINAYYAFIQKKNSLSGEVFNLGGGPDNTLSLIELLNLLEEKTGKKNQINYSDWRPSDQKVYISDITKAQNKLGWKPMIPPSQGIEKLLEWLR